MVQLLSDRAGLQDWVLGPKYPWPYHVVSYMVNIFSHLFCRSFEVNEARRTLNPALFVWHSSQGAVLPLGASARALAEGQVL